MLAGLLGGLLAFGFATIFGEPQVDRAIAFEEQHAATETATVETAGVHGHEELVSRGVQSTVGLFTGVVVYGVTVGGFFALVFAYAYGRVGELSPRATAALLAGAGFLAVVLVPAIKYPPNPPAISDPDTISFRTGLHFLMLAISLAAGFLAWSLRRHLVERCGAWNGSLLAAGLFLMVVIVAQIFLPTVDEMPADFPADVLWSFRTSSLGLQLVLWTTIGLVFGAFAQRSLIGRASTI